MDDLLRAAMEQRGGYAFRSDLLALGLTDRHLGWALRHGILRRLRHGTYALASAVDVMSPQQEHLLRAFSVVDKLGPGVALSHHSAAIAHTGQSYGVDLSTVHVTRLDGRGGRSEAGVTFHVGAVVPDDDLCTVKGRQAVVPPRAVIESCSLATVESGMVAASFALRAQACTRDELTERMHQHQRWPGMLNVRLALAQAEPACESVGEVRSLYMFSVTGVPRPEAQFHVMSDDDVEVARNDFGWKEWRHVGEFDGLIKYGRLNPYSDAELGQVLIDEKRREDAVRDQYYGMSRWTWTDLDPRRRTNTAARILAGLERSRRLYARGAVHFPLSS